MAVPVREKGYAHNRWWWGPPEDAEETPELRWPLNIEVYDQMRRQDAQVMSVLRAVTLPVRRTEWRIDPAGARDEVVEFVADDLGLPITGQERTPLRTRDRFSWPDHLRLALLMLTFGSSFFEQTYRIVDGKARLRKLGWRPPRTISEVEVAPDGGLKWIRQHSATYGVSDKIPVAQLVCYVNEREGGNWLGQSLLRPAFKSWLLKDRALRTQAMTLDRNGLGVPVYEGAPIEADGRSSEELEELQKTDLANGLKITTGFRGGDNSGAAIPNGSKLLLLGVQGDLPDADRPLRYHDEQIAKAVLANFLNLGGDNSTGSYALGETFADFFVMSLQTVADSVADVTNQHVIEDLVDLNFGVDVPAPRLVHDEIGARHPATAQAIKFLLDSRAITPDDVLEIHLRTQYGLPLPDPETARPQPAMTTTTRTAPADQQEEEPS